MNELTQEYLKECLIYDKDTGIFTHKERPLHHFKNSHWMNNFNSRHLNKQCHCIGCHGYIVIAVNGKRYLAHRLAWLYVYGVWPEIQIDHRDTIRTNNRINNLRESTQGQNRENVRTKQSNNKSGFLGVHLDKQSKKFMAQKASRMKPTPQ